MNEILWKIPVPVTSIIQGPYFKDLMKHRCNISFSIEGENGEEVQLTLLFEGVQAFKCTHMASLGSIRQELISQAYGRLVSLKNSPWLNEIKNVYTEYYNMGKFPNKEILHLMICFDDGPCYEFVAESWTIL